jgi:DinB superfamily
MSKLDELVTLVETKIANFEALNPEVSKASVGWHIEHTLLTLNGTIYYLSKSNPKDYKWKFNFMRIIVFMRKKIPRGRAKSPEVVVPKGDLNVENLKTHITKTREKIKELELLNDNCFFKHPYFGELKRKQAISFLEIHTQHHLEIINDIINFKK